jgi:hypothetical protein
VNSANAFPTRYRYGATVAVEEPAAGVTGTLHRDMAGNTFFRIYRDEGKFDDYMLRHDDLEVTISPGALASFYTIGDDRILDHSPEVLGLRRA